MQFRNWIGHDGGASDVAVGGNCEPFNGHYRCGAVQGGVQGPKRGVVRGAVAEPGLFHVALPQVPFAGDQAPCHPLQDRLRSTRWPLHLHPRLRLARRRSRPRWRLLRRRRG